MALKPENEVIGEHKIPEGFRHRDTFTYIIEDAPNVFFFGCHRESNHRMIGAVTIKLLGKGKASIRVCLLPSDPIKKMLFKIDVIQWLMWNQIEEIGNFTTGEFFEEMLLEFPGATRTGKWIQFEKNPLIEAVWKVRQ